jgi:hypothetical protein
MVNDCNMHGGIPWNSDPTIGFGKTNRNGSCDGTFYPGREQFGYARRTDHLQRMVRGIRIIRLYSISCHPRKL